MWHNIGSIIVMYPLLRPPMDHMESAKDEIHSTEPDDRVTDNYEKKCKHSVFYEFLFYDLSYSLQL